MQNRLLVSFLLLVITLVAAQQLEPKFKIFPLQGQIKEFVWVGKDVAYVRTDEHSYETVNGGATWTHLNEELCQAFNCVYKMVKNPIDDDSILLLGRTPEENWLLTNLLQKRHVITKVKIADKNAHVTMVRWHPTDKNILLALVQKKNTSGKDLYISKDGGRTFGTGPVRSQIIDAQWGSPDAADYSASQFNGIRTREGERTFFQFDINSLTSSDVVVENAFEFFHIKQFLFVATRDPHTREAGLFTSTNNGRTFKRVKFSSGAIDDATAAFTILDGSEGSVFINVFHATHGNEPFGDVYLSDATGVRYSVSLNGNRRKGSACDFHKLASLEGVYIANVVTSASRADHDCANCGAEGNNCDEKCQYTSVISFDKGGEWKFIMAPEHDSRGKKITCKTKIPGTERCHLHLHGFVAQGPSRIHSHKDAVGLVFATGNYGPHLNPSEVDVNTFLSRDGGLSWTEIAKGSHVYEMTDHGGLILIAPDKSYTNKIKYSWTSGSNFTEVQFGVDEMVIEKIHHPQDTLSRSLIVQGARNGNAVMLHVDFSDIHQKECRGIENPQDPDSDYEYFKPHSYESDKCLLGRIVEYTRRKADRPCFNPQQAQTKPIKIANCPCTPADYTCDLYFERDFKAEEGTQVVCKPVKGEEGNIRQVPDRCNGYYNETKGYIKVAGDSCQGGINLDPIPRKCPASISFFGIVLLVFFLFILLSFTSIYLYKNTSFLQNMINGPLGLVSYNPIQANEEFGLDDEEQDSEPDEIEESTFSNFKRGEVASDENDFKVASLDPIPMENNNFNPRAKRQ